MSTERQSHSDVRRGPAHCLGRSHGPLPMRNCLSEIRWASECALQALAGTRSSSRPSTERQYHSKIRRGPVCCLNLGEAVQPRPTTQSKTASARSTEHQNVRSMHWEETRSSSRLSSARQSHSEVRRGPAYCLNLGEVRPVTTTENTSAERPSTSCRSKVWREARSKRPIPRLQAMQNTNSRR